MIGIDSNVIIRYAVLDDPKQAAAATKLIDSFEKRGSQLFVNRIVLCEVVWVLEQTYGYTRSSIIDFLETLLFTDTFDIEDSVEAWEALKISRAYRIDFADAFHALTNEERGCEKTLTFDRKATRMSSFELMH